MLVRRLLIALPLIALLLATGVVFLSAHAPRTWASHWSAPAALSAGSGAQDFGAVADGPSGWDLLWVDDLNGTLDYTVAPGAGAAPSTRVVDRGEISQPYMATVHGHTVGAWVHTYNGASSLQTAVLDSGIVPRVVTLIRSAGPLEHPQVLAGPHGTVALLFSWQRHSNFDLYLLTLSSSLHTVRPAVRLDHAAYYSFFPRGVFDAAGTLHLLHLENCCKQELWQVWYDRYSATSRHLSARLLYTITSYAQSLQIAPQWGEAIQRDPAGNIWGSYVGDGGIWLFKAAPSGRLLARPRLVDVGEGVPTVVAMVLNGHGGRLFWDQPYDLGTYVATARFASDAGLVGSAERAMYESGSQSSPHAIESSGATRVVYQSVSQSIRSRFETIDYETGVQPTVAQRLGLGLGNPWQELALLLLGSLSMATIVTTGNIIAVLVLAALGIALLRVTRAFPGRWLLYEGGLVAALYALFVAPGGPLLFLSAMPAMGLAAMPFGLLATGGALLGVVWTGNVALKRVDDVFRAGALAFLGVYFFAFVETIVFIQGRLGYI